MKLIILLTFFAVACAHTATSQLTSKYFVENSEIRKHFEKFPIRKNGNFFYLLFLGEFRSLRMLKMKLKLCQPTVCNKCRKIVAENASRKHVKQCKRVLDLEDCCNQTRSYSGSLFG